MSIRGCVVAALLLLAACAASPGPAPSAPRDEGAIEAARLRAEMLATVPRAAAADPAEAARWIPQARRLVTEAGLAPAEAEFALLVDRAPAVQRIALLLLRRDGPREVLATAPVSTGRTGRRGFFVTPTGVFANDGSVQGYRALGTRNAQGIRGLGAAGMRAWDFGWVWAARGWAEDGGEAPIRFLLHATDPDVLEARLGRPDSQGCVRIGGAMNRFVDANGIIDAEIERQAASDPRAASLLLPERRPTALAGRLLIVVDSAADQVPPARPAPEPPGRSGCPS
ncbi:L,D-transpeptidase [Roseomonas sp. PWR1]|uniref:L,D-transpeptidase n=1 Tax=Roseomonas nitratireducens TaxID=2820810 RepID=A0ABS4APT1_9PROT|nr:L,D-transpeptidase [Neoroseomonas nitratireducens]MBP0463374.1 L,D-transpeptidase [Neoroseomonas nitratireducens]